MIKITVDGGHGSYKDSSRNVYATPGKRTPEGIPEWEFNNKVVKAFINFLSNYENVAVLRVDDPTGKTDIPLKDRVNRAKSWGSQAHFSIHHNAMRGAWFETAGGIETFVRTGTKHYNESLKLAKLTHPKYVEAMGLRDRGIKFTSDLYMLGDSIGCPAILTEGGFMDSRVDRKAMDSDAKLKAQGEAIGKGAVSYFGLKMKSTKVEKEEEVRMFKPSNAALKNGMGDLITIARKQGLLSSDVHMNNLKKDKLTLDDAVGIIATVYSRALEKENTK